MSAGGDKHVIMNMDCDRAQPLISVEAKPARRRSMSGLADADDLMSRRMEVVAGRLMGCRQLSFISHYYVDSYGITILVSDR